MRVLILLFILIPAAEIGVLLLSGNTIGIWPTVVLLIATGVLGSYLAKKQGMNTLRKVQEQLQYGRMPGDEILNGVCILLGGVMLLSPGFLTDIFGLILLLPPTRAAMKPIILKTLKKWMNNNTFTIIR
ncbi:FxsA family protein [Niallia endozanthoxylica]|uniref:Membrane protein FxsA n=1 Tax=Niallia endozanthoxylica TaxID=2036016 RepID=A0A5J5I7L4_9BACI|nr:FxsA family protein [Niallia endozanthoxylica]KAA9031706.1 membrane protein FxsA [Niallia endozanthoxylica]